MKARFANALLFLLFFVAAFDARAQYHVSSWSVVPAGVTSRLDLVGGSVHSCIPVRADVSIAGPAMSVVLVPMGGDACFSAGRPFSLATMLPPSAIGPYAVTVTTQDRPGTVAQFDIVVPAGAASGQQIPLGGPMPLAALAGFVLLVAALRLRATR